MKYTNNIYNIKWRSNMRLGFLIIIKLLRVNSLNITTLIELAATI